MITDLLTLDDFIRLAAMAVDGVQHYLPLSNGEKAVDEIDSYYNNDYVGTTVFFQVAEILRKDGLMTFQCSLTLAMKPDGAGARAGLEARNSTLRLLMKLLGDLTLLAEDTIAEVEEQGEEYDLIITPVDRIFPIALLANVNLEGHYVDLDVTVPANPLLFP